MKWERNECVLEEKINDYVVSYKRNNRINIWDMKVVFFIVITLIDERNKNMYFDTITFSSEDVPTNQKQLTKILKRLVRKLKTKMKRGRKK